MAAKPALAALVVLFALAVAALVVSSGWSMLFRRGAPERALQLAPWNADANAQVAARALMPQRNRVVGPAQLRKAEEHARRALERQPSNVPAWRVLGSVAALKGDARGALAGFETAEFFSRRDAATQLWLIEDRVRSGDIEGALRHYDVVLRTNPRTWDLLLPILVQSAGQPQIVGPLAKLVSRPSNWQEPFIIKLVTQPPSPADATRLLTLMRRHGPLPGREGVANLATGLASRGEARSAERIYQLLQDPIGARQAVRNGSFEDENDIPPLDWTFVDGAEMSAEQSDGRLRIRASYDGGGTAATQLLVLDPGAYRIAAMVGREQDAEPASIIVSVRCLPSGTELVSVKSRPSPQPGNRIGGAFNIARSCGEQQLRIAADWNKSGDERAAWVDNVTVTRVGSR